MVTYQDTIDKQVHYALKKGEISEEPSLVRVHMPELFNDLFASTRQGARHWPIERALGKVSEEGGVVVILGKEEDSNSKIAR